MKRSVLSLLLALVMLSSCRDNKKPFQPTAQDSTAPPKETEKPDSTMEIPWVAVYNDNTQLLELKKNPLAPHHPADPKVVIEALNLRYPQIKLEWVGRDGTTAMVKIADAANLTEGSGSTGAESYLAEATFSLTEIENIHAVDFHFTEGDHASPGIYTRKSFKDFH